MALRQTESVPLPAPAPGTSRHLERLRYGQAGRGPKAYLQAGLHADEPPGMLVLHHLAERLDALPDSDILGEIMLVPVANPIGLTQYVSGELVGRFDLGGQGNFNRNYPVLTEAVAERIAGRLSRDASSNITLIRTALRAALAGIMPMTELDHLRLALMQDAIDADIMLDLHCDCESLMHLYLGTPLWPAAHDLAALLGAEATLLAEDSGGSSFDEAIAGPWWALARRFPSHPIPPACLAATVELRGQADVSDTLAATDADAVIRLLRRRGVLAGDPGPLPPLPRDASDLRAADMIRAPSAGLVVYAKALGDPVAKGEAVADIVSPGGSRVTVRSQADGFLLARLRDRYARPGRYIAKVIGRDPLAHRQGVLLTD